MGHGSLILGHNDPEILDAMQAQLARGTHYGAGPRAGGALGRAGQPARALGRAREVHRLRTEATLLAIRVARSFTGRPTVLKFEGHFHGWHDYLLKGEKPPFEATSVPASRRK